MQDLLDRQRVVMTVETPVQAKEHVSVQRAQRRRQRRFAGTEAIEDERRS